MKRKIYITIIIAIIVILFNIKLTYAYTYTYRSTNGKTIEIIQNKNKNDVEKYIKSTYGSLNDIVVVSTSGITVSRLHSKLTCNEVGNYYKIKLGSRKTNSNDKRNNKEFIWEISFIT